MNNQKKIEVSAKLYKFKNEWDFGMFPKHLADKTIKVNYGIWHDFVEARERYEIIYEELRLKLERLPKI